MPKKSKSCFVTNRKYWPKDFDHPVLAALGLIVLCTSLAISKSASADMVVRPGSSGKLGIWLVAAPLFGSETQLRFTTDESTDTKTDTKTGEKVVRVARGETVVPGRTFSPMQATGHFDLKKKWGSQPNRYALFAGILRVKKPSTLVMILESDDSIRVSIDDRILLNKDLVRPALHADDGVTFDLPVGDHPILIRLRQRSGEWKFSARLLDASDLRPARDVQFVLPGVDINDVAVAELLQVELGMKSFGNRYEPFLLVRAEGGLPEDIDVPVSVTASVVGKQDPILYRLNLGSVPLGIRGVHPLHARLPEVMASSLMAENAEKPVEYRVKLGAEERVFIQRGHPEARAALTAIDQALESLQSNDASKDDTTCSTLELSRSRIESFLSTRDADTTAIVEESRASKFFAEHVIEGRNPLKEIRGPMRLAYPSALDGKNRPFGVYIPSSYGKEQKRWPLVVVLHGLDGLPMQMIRIFFGKDHPTQRAPWEDRHIGTLPALDAFVVSPSGFGNIAYREFGEVDVMHLVRWMKETYPIDEDRVYVTGLSMGGIGAAAIGLRFADQFAAMEPLCGYHSYALRRDMANRRLRPWEKALSSFWSNSSWAENGRNLPLYVVHGQQDKPVANSGVLIDRYKDLGYFVYSEHPDVGHNVWQQTYEGFKGYGWLAKHKRDPQPKEVVLKTSSLRYDTHAWVRVMALDEHLSWGEIRAKVRSTSRIDVEASGVRAFVLTRPTKHLDSSLALVVSVQGQELEFAPNEPVILHRNEGQWARGAPQTRQGLCKTKGLSGPIRDAFLEPLVFVAGTRDPSLTQANLHVARALASPPFGVEARWPIIADVDVTDTMASSHSLFLVGSPQSNAYLARLEDQLPIRVKGSQVMAGDKVFEGRELGVLFVHPNPLHPDRYVVVLAAPDVGGMLRALSLPRMLPDFVVYDEKVSGARGQMVLGSASLLAGGTFDEQWQLPSVFHQ